MQKWHRLVKNIDLNAVGCDGAWATIMRPLVSFFKLLSDDDVSLPLLWYINAPSISLTNWPTKVLHCKPNTLAMRDTHEVLYPPLRAIHGHHSFQSVNIIWLPSLSQCTNTDWWLMLRVHTLLLLAPALLKVISSSPASGSQTVHPTFWVPAVNILELSITQIALLYQRKFCLPTAFPMTDYLVGG